MGFSNIALRVWIGYHENSLFGPLNKHHPRSSGSGLGGGLSANARNITRFASRRLSPQLHHRFFPYARISFLLPVPGYLASEMSWTPPTPKIRAFLHLKILVHGPVTPPRNAYPSRVKLRRNVPSFVAISLEKVRDNWRFANPRLIPDA